MRGHHGYPLGIVRWIKTSLEPLVEPVVKSVGIALLPVLHLAFVVFVDLATLLAWAFAGGCYVEMHPAPLFYISMLHP